MMKNRKIEFIIVLILLTVAIAAIVLIKTNRTEGTTVHIYVDGTEYGAYDLNTDNEIMIETAEGFNLVRIEGGSVKMESADCPNRLCVNMFPLTSGDTDMIVCLPHKVIVKLD